MHTLHSVNSVSSGATSNSDGIFSERLHQAGNFVSWLLMWLFALWMWWLLFPQHPCKRVYFHWELGLTQIPPITRLPHLLPALEQLGEIIRGFESQSKEELALLWKSYLIFQYFCGFNFIMEHWASIDFQLKLLNTSMRLAHHIEMNIKKEVNFWRASGRTSF